jgi:hypothetical protein
MSHAGQIDVNREADMPAPTGVALHRLVRPLRLNLKGCYFDAIKAGTKTHEYRLAEKWENRLAGKTYDEIHLLRGYPKRGDESRILRRAWNGYTIEMIQHPHFGDKLVRVLAIDVTKWPNEKS